MSPGQKLGRAYIIVLLKDLTEQMAQDKCIWLSGHSRPSVAPVGVKLVPYKAT